MSGRGYGYADGLNLTGITDQVSAANSVNLWYSPTSRLEEAGGAWGQSTFYYDAVGNRTYHFNTLAAVTTQRIQDYAANNNRLTGMTENGAALWSYTYDGAGNTLTEVRPGESFAYT